LALGCALLHEPPLLFLDEPTGGVDPVSRRDFWRLIDDLSRGGTTVLVTTHYMDEAERCDRVAIIQAGKMAALGTIAELKAVFADRQILEIRSADPMKTMAAADALPMVEKTSLFGTAVHAVLRKGSADVQHTLKDALAKSGVTIENIEPVVPSLDDVFL